MTCYQYHLVPEARLFNICGWLSKQFGWNAASRIFLGWLTAYTKSGLKFGLFTPCDVLFLYFLLLLIESIETDVTEYCVHSDSPLMLV